MTLDGAATLTDPTPSALVVVNKELSSNVATLTTSSAHGLYVDAEIVVADVDATFNGTYTVTQVPSATTVQYAVTASDVASTSASGTITASTDDRITVSIDYSDIRGLLGMVDPGTWDLYASRQIDGTTETVYICSGNLSVSLATPLINAYTV